MLEELNRLRGKLRRILLFPYYYKIVVVHKFHKSKARKILDRRNVNANKNGTKDS